MIRIFGIKTDALPSCETILADLSEEWISVWSMRHGDPMHAKNSLSMRQSLGGLLLLHRMGADGRLCYEDGGRPYLADASADFSITHTDGFVLCALETDSCTPRVGLDAESLSRISTLSYPALASRWFAPAEQKMFDASPTPECFARIWTRKEALVKYRGTGLSGLHAADTAVAEKSGIRFTEYRVGDVLVTLCHATEGAPKKIEYPTDHFCDLQTQ
ncbi:MAG: 4'-phosphopantetheinyl transferase superfamily protein [Clostridia bacterium]|nr:4'-phosphopantetheinyl transferase superfamily protein [Clostridia bacterium]